MSHIETNGNTNQTRDADVFLRAGEGALRAGVGVEERSRKGEERKGLSQVV